jgi:hypothetical protein
MIPQCGRHLDFSRDLIVNARDDCFLKSLQYVQASDPCEDE